MTVNDVSWQINNSKMEQIQFQMSNKIFKKLTTISSKPMQRRAKFVNQNEESCGDGKIVDIYALITAQIS